MTFYEKQSWIQIIFSNASKIVMIATSRPLALNKKLKFSVKNFSSKCDRISIFLQIFSHLLKKSLTENFIFLGLKTF